MSRTGPSFKTTMQSNAVRWTVFLGCYTRPQLAGRPFPSLPKPHRREWIELDACGRSNDHTSPDRRLRAHQTQPYRLTTMFSFPCDRNRGSILNLKKKNK